MDLTSVNNTHRKYACLGKLIPNSETKTSCKLIQNVFMFTKNHMFVRKDLLLFLPGKCIVVFCGVCVSIVTSHV